MEEKKDIYVYRVLVGKPEGKRPVLIPKRRWENNIEMEIQEVGCRVWTESSWPLRNVPPLPGFTYRNLNYGYVSENKSCVIQGYFLLLKDIAAY
jgi:hypothetical protein